MEYISAPSAHMLWQILTEAPTLRPPQNITGANLLMYSIFLGCSYEGLWPKTNGGPSSFHLNTAQYVVEGLWDSLPSGELSQFGTTTWDQDKQADLSSHFYV